MWLPSRADQNSIRKATRICRPVSALPGSAISAEAMPTTPVPKVHTASMKPLLPVRCWIAQAPVMMAASASNCTRRRRGRSKSSFRLHPVGPQQRYGAWALGDALPRAHTSETREFPGQNARAANSDADASERPCAS